MLEIVFTGQFKRDVKRAEKRGKDLTKLWGVVEILRKGEPLPPRFRNHKLVGNRVGFWECHLEPDWLLVYSLEADALYLTGLGTHADLFR